MEDIQELIQGISEDIIQTAVQVKKALIKAENFQDSVGKSSERYDEDDFTNYINAHQYVIDDLKQALRCLSGAHMQCRCIVEDRHSVEQKYGRIN